MCVYKCMHLPMSLSSYLSFKQFSKFNAVIYELYQGTEDLIYKYFLIYFIFSYNSLHAF